MRRAGTGLVAVAVASLLASGPPASATQTPQPPAATVTAPATTLPPSADPTVSTSPTPARVTPKPKPTRKRPSPTPSSTSGADHGSAEKKAAQKKATAAPDPHDDAELIAAAQALQSAQDDLDTARATLTTARDELAIAQEAAADASTDLEVAVVAEAQVSRALALVESRVVTRTVDLGRLARASYQASGPLGEWQLVLELQSPDQLTDRLAAMQSVASASNAVISDLSDDRSDLQSTRDQLTAARRHQEEVKVRAEAALASTRAKEKAAADAEAQVGVVVAARQVALANARKAIAADKVHYRSLLAESGALSQRIVSMAAKLGATKSPPAGTGTFTRPGRGAVTSPYGMRYHPILHYVKLHTGTDFGADDGVAHAADDGVVLLTEYNVAYGNMTVIDHGTIGGLHVSTLYAHQAAFAVEPGQRVRKGQVIGVIGSTGYATGPHLHFEVRIDGSPTDPSPWLVGAPLPPAVSSP